MGRDTRRARHVAMWRGAALVAYFNHPKTQKEEILQSFSRDLQMPNLAITWKSFLLQTRLPRVASGMGFQ